MNKKQGHKKVFKFILIVCCLLLGEVAVFAQNKNASQNPVASDTNVIKKEKQGFLSFLKRLFHKRNQNDYVQQKKSSKKDSTAAKKPHKVEPFEFTKGSVTWTSLYTQGINLNTGVNGLYSLGRLSQGFDVYGAPFTAQGTGVFNNGQFERSYSSYSINFDIEAYQSAMRKRAENILLNKRAGGKMPNLSDSLTAYESLREKIQSPSYLSEENAYKAQFQKEEDSLQKHPGADTTEIHKLRTKLYTYESLEKRYQQLFAIKKNYSNLEKADSSGRKYEQDAKLLNNPDNVEKLLEENHQLSGFEKILMGVQKFSIGQSGEEMSEFTFHSFMMNGLNVGYKSDNIYTCVGYGKEIAVVNPYLMTGITVPTYNRTVEFVRTGEGPDNGDNFYATIIKIADPGGNTSINETNWVLDLTKQVTIGKNLSFQAELAKSMFSYIPGKFDSTALPFTPENNNNLALALRAKGTLPGTNTTIKAEVSQTGGDYVTLGNPYLIIGANKYEVDIIQPIGNKIKVDIGGTHIEEDVTASDGTRESDNWIQFSILYKPTSQINLEFKYAPSKYQQESSTIYANSTTNNINQVSLTGTIASLIFDEKTTTTFFAGNFQCNTGQTSELMSQNLNLSYYMLSELWILSPTQGINISADESRNNWTGGLSQFIGQGTYNVNLKKSLTVGFGPQWVEQPGVLDNGIGLTGSLSSSIQKWGRIGLQFTGRNNIERPLCGSPQYLISGNISIVW